MKKLTAYLLTLGIATLPYIRANVGSTLNDESTIKQRVLDYLEYKENLIPHWDIEEIKNDKLPKLNQKIKLPSTYCAMYARIIADKEYGKKYARNSHGDSWNRIYHDNVIAKINEISPQENWKELDTLAMKGELKPGMIVGFYYTRSHYKNKKDEQGKKVIATHNAIYRGTQVTYNEKTGKEEVSLVFDQQWGSKIERITTNSDWIHQKQEIIFPTYIVDAKK